VQRRCFELLGKPYEEVDGAPPVLLYSEYVQLRSIIDDSPCRIRADDSDGEGYICVLENKIYRVYGSQLRKVLCSG
jgi:hypothetical protein